MKYALLLLALMIVFVPLTSQAAEPPVAVRAWFTQADISGSVQVTAPPGDLREANGTIGKGIYLDKPVPVENPIYSNENGFISFWIKPDWNGNDGKTHRILRIGDPGKNGLVLEKAASGMLRYVMSTTAKTTASRTDVSSWKAGEWHQVSIGWTSVNGNPVGLPLWIDRTCLDGPIFGADEFPNPTDTRLWIGDATTDAVIDELIIRTRFDTETKNGMLGITYRDYFRTAPYKKIAIDLQPHYGPMDPRVVVGCQKQFGVLAEQNKKMEKITNFGVRYAQWTYFDAKPFIKWTTSDDSIAAVDENGMVTGKALGKCKLTVEFRGMKASYMMQVIPIEQADLDLVYVERLPKYPWDAAKNNPAPGDKVQSVARIINFGYATAPAGSEVIFQLIPDSNNNFRLDSKEKAIQVQRQVINRELKPREEITMTFDWTWTDEPTWVRVIVDPKGKFTELCNANNERCELNIARPLRMGVETSQMESFYKDKIINHIGSFSEYDWSHGQIARFDAMLREAVYSTTSPDGVRDAFRIDKIYETKFKDRDSRNEPYEREEKFYDGGFPVNEPINTMAVDTAILHEYGHTCAALPDLYGYWVAADNVLLRDESGKFYAGGPLMPSISSRSSMMPLSSANNVPCGVGYGYLMDGCQLNMCSWHAGQIQWFVGYRGPRFWAVQDNFIPMFENYLRIYDINDQPLKGAAVYVYDVINPPIQDAGAKYFADRPKFIGHTDSDGRFQFPHNPDSTWDDPSTETVEGDSLYLIHPFDRVSRDINFTPNVWSVEGLMLVKIVSGEQTEFYWLPLTEFNRVFFEGQQAAGTIEIKTSLTSSERRMRLVRPEIPEAIREVNKRPVAVVSPTELTVKCGEEFTLDGSKSSDPEGQQLLYRWSEQGDWLRGDLSKGATCTIKAPDEPTEMEIRFYVIDGLCCSEPVFVKVKVEK